MSKTVHFEGIAGAGKSTASQRFCELLKEKDVDAVWWLEEAADHPLKPKARTAASGNNEFSEVCINAWQSFLNSQTNAVSIFDGYAFQSTVRFLFERQARRCHIVSYFQQWQELAPDTSIIYFYVDNLIEHYETVLAERGDDWTQKLFSWVERTPIGTALHLKGKSGFVEFWTIYQALCLELLESANIETEIIESRSWNDKVLESLAVRRGFR